MPSGATFLTTIADLNAWFTNEVSMWVTLAHATTLREKRSSMGAKYTVPSSDEPRMCDHRHGNYSVRPFSTLWDSMKVRDHQNLFPLSSQAQQE